MRPGTDVSLRECRESGYPIIEYFARDLLPDGTLNPEAMIDLTISNPENWPWGVNKIGVLSRDLYRRTGYYCFKELKEAFLRAGQGIKDYCDWKHCPIELERPHPMDFLHLAGILDGYTDF
jgi:hypothetical protein